MKSIRSHFAINISIRRVWPTTKICILPLLPGMPFKRNSCHISFMSIEHATITTLAYPDCVFQEIWYIAWDIKMESDL